MNSKNISIKVENWDDNNIWFDDVNLSSSDTSEQVTFLYPDHLGTPISPNFDYLPFGGVYQGTPETNLRFPGQYQDRVDLYQNGFRDYNPRLGRYMEPDPIGQWSDVNLYPYVGNNAVIFIDPLGLKWLRGKNDPALMGSDDAPYDLLKPRNPFLEFLEYNVPNFYETSRQHDQMLKDLGIQNPFANPLNILINIVTMPVAYKKAFDINMYETLTGKEETIFGKDKVDQCK